MDKHSDDPPLTFIKARRLLDMNQHDEAWCTEVEAAISAIGDHISTAQAEVDSTDDAVIRERATILIGELITTRQKLQRTLDEARTQSPSLLKVIKHTLGLDEKDKANLPPSNPSDDLPAP